MTPDERNLINGLFDRMRGHGAIEKDRDAEALINNAVRQIPDSAYMLVQSVLVQEHALQQADQRIQELEARVQQLEAMGSRQAPASGGFLGGLFGGGQRAAAPQPQYGQPPQGSVPAFGRGAPMQGGQPQGGPWGGRAAQYGQPQQAAPAAGGGFMRTAMATAAGVAGGMLLANSISGMMNGNQSTASTAATDSNDPGAASGAEGQQAMDYQDPANNDPGSYDSAADTGGWDMGGDSEV